MHPRHPEPEGNRAAAAPPDRGVRAVGLLRHVRDPDIRVGGEAEAPKAPAQSARDAPRPGIVHADHGRLGASGELHERVLERRYRAVALQVVGLDVVHDRHGRMQCEEGLVVLVGLDHEQVVARDACVPAPRAHPASGDPGRGKASRCERLGGHDGGRGLAVRARDRHRTRPADQRRERFLARHDRQAERPRANELRMARRHRRGDDDRAGALEM
jgi:hypothetical protein